ncbi:MAG: transcription termination/antitermination protein NusA [Clostridia bacterium]|nr:transcription termination/antitermination protein NusA [Clostridia bacterium]
MAKKKPQEQPNDVQEMFSAMRELEKAKGIPMELLLDNIERSIEKACKNHFGNEDVVFKVDPDNNIFEAYLRKTVVEHVADPKLEIEQHDAAAIDPGANIGEKVLIRIDPKRLGRISVQNARSVIRQGIRDKEREITLDEFRKKSKEIVTAVVENIDPETGNATIRIGKSIATLPVAEQIGLENLKEGDSVKVYIAEIKEPDPDAPGKKKSRGPRAIISRTSSDFVKRLFEMEVPEIYDGTVEIMAASREAGSRTKIAVHSKNPDVDSVGACIGTRGMRVAKIVEELGGEKIDIIEYREDPEAFIAAALSPATVLSVKATDVDKKEWRATVPDSQLSLAIGNKGQNARLAAKLTGCKIDIRPESGFYGEDEDEEQEDNIVADDTADELIEEPISLDD